MNQAVHPRVRGDNDNQRAMRRIIRRFTPACAGTTPRLTDALRLRAVHPRVRGDNALASLNKSSRSLRFTPACAGTTRGGGGERPPGTVHPRVRGDNGYASMASCATDGSPPRARGQLVFKLLKLFGNRFTPACAGTTRRRVAMAGSSAVHPRVRGDNWNCTGRCFSIRGSPPRARGQQLHPPSFSPLFRFTPACAGTTLKLRLIFLDAHQPKPFEVFDPP